MFSAKYALVVVLAGGCASTPHTTPGEMSAADHQDEAAQEAEEARALTRDEPVAGRDDDWNQAGSVQAMEANEHWRAAAAHGEAARALFAAEATACDGTSNAARTNPFEPVDRLASVTRVVWQSGAPAGVVVAFRKTAGVEEAQLRRTLRCHAAHAATLGYRGAGLDESPAALEGVSVVVGSSPDGSPFVRIVSNEAETAREIARRAEALGR